MSIATIGDVLDASLQHPETENCPHCGGRGTQHAPYFPLPITCTECGGTGKREPEVPEPKRPGLGDEIKDELKSKKFRSW